MLTLPTDVAGLLECASDEDKNVRGQVAYELAKLSADEDARSLIYEALHDSNERVRLAAVRAVAGWAPEIRPVDELRRALHDPDSSVRVAAVCAVGRSGKGRYVAPLALSDANPTVRVVAVQQLWPVAGAEAEELGVKCLADPDWRVRYAAALLLRDHRGPASRGALIEALDDRYAGVRRAAVWGLTKIGGQEVVEPLIGRLRDRKRSIRAEAARSLGELQDPRAVEPLLDLLARSTSGFMRAAAVGGLGHLNDQRAIGPIVSALRGAWTADPYVGQWAYDDSRGEFQLRREATAALIRLGGPAADAVVAGLPEEWVAWIRDPDL